MSNKLKCPALTQGKVGCDKCIWDKQYSGSSRLCIEMKEKYEGNKKSPEGD